MNIGSGNPSRHSIISNAEENEIREIFYQHWEKMKNQRKSVIDGISVWRLRSIQEINSYADEQLRMFQADYNYQRGIFDKKRLENLEIARACHQSKQNDLFSELRNACRSLEFRVAQLECVRNQNERPRVITVEGQTRNNKHDKNDTYVHVSEDHRTESIIEDANITQENGGYISKSSRKSIPNDRSQWPCMTSASNVNDRSTNNNNNSSASTANGDASNNKCPICFMIFPLHMTHNDRHRHVDEHTLDDENAYDVTI